MAEQLTLAYPLDAILCTSQQVPGTGGAHGKDLTEAILCTSKQVPGTGAAHGKQLP